MLQIEHSCNQKDHVLRDLPDLDFGGRPGDRDRRDRYVLLDVCMYRNRYVFLEVCMYRNRYVSMYVWRYALRGFGGVTFREAC